MSPSSDLEQEVEINGEAISEQHAIHEYAFGIMSSDRAGMATIVGISEPYKKRLSESESSNNNDDSTGSEGFQSWSMSMYQSLYHSGEFPEEVEQDSLSEDDNNNLTELASSAPESRSFLREYRKQSFKTFANGVGTTGGSHVFSKKQKQSLTRRWSTSSIFGGGKSVPQQSRCTSADPDDPDFILEPEPTEGWLSSITHIPDKIRQHMADKHRFNVKSVPREQLKQLYCY